MIKWIKWFIEKRRVNSLADAIREKLPNAIMKSYFNR